MTSSIKSFSGIAFGSVACDDDAVSLRMERFGEASANSRTSARDQNCVPGDLHVRYSHGESVFAANASGVPEQGRNWGLYSTLIHRAMPLETSIR